MHNQDDLTPTATISPPVHCTQKVNAFSCTARSVCKLRATCVLHPYSPWHATGSPVSLGVCKSPKILQSHKAQKVWYPHGRTSGLAQTHPRLTNSTKATISVTTQSKTQQTSQQGTLTGTAAPHLTLSPKGQTFSSKPASGPGLEAISLGKSCFSLAVRFLIDLSVVSFSVKAKC